MLRQERTLALLEKEAQRVVWQLEQPVRNCTPMGWDPLWVFFVQAWLAAIASPKPPSP